MKNLLSILLICFLFVSCEKENYNFDVTRTIYLTPINRPESCGPDIHKIHFTFDNKSVDELHAEEASHTFEKWIVPFDTIHIYKGPIYSYPFNGQIYNLYIVSADSVYEKMTEHGIPYYCPSY